MKDSAGRRAEGFSGQHLVVLPASVRLDSARDPLLRGLHVTDAGFFPRAVGHYVERTAGTPSHLIVVCAAGQGWVRVAGAEPVGVAAGALAWLPARRAHAYGADAAQPWTIAWVHVSGDEADAWREHLGLPVSGGVRALENAAQAVQVLQEIHQVLETGYPRANLVWVAARVRGLLADIARRPAGSLHARSSAERIAATVEWMRARLDQPLRLAELAAAASLSVQHYAELFSRRFGYGPIDFLIRLRIQRACQLLDTTELSIKEIARRVGFGDAFYFSRQFRAIMGKSPRAYRRVTKG